METIKNPLVAGWYADPEARFYEGKYWIYVTRSATDYKKQTNLDAFSSVDGIRWTKHEGIIRMEDFPYVTQAVWAPTILRKDGKYYLIFASNDIHRNEEPGGIEIAEADRPEGPFRSMLGRPLIDRFIYGAQPIDAHLFGDEDGRIYLYYGGWGHCNIAEMSPEMNGFIRNKEGNLFKEITPPGYVEGPCMMKYDGTYFLMWASGNWTDGTYCVNYCSASSPWGPFQKTETILEAQEGIADGPGHNGYLEDNKNNKLYIVYHRRYIGDKEPGHRVLCMDRMEIENGRILPIIMT